METLEKFKERQVLSKNHKTLVHVLKKGNYGLVEKYNTVLENIQGLIFETQTYISRINESFEDNYLTYDEAISLLENIEPLKKSYSEFKIAEKSNRMVLATLQELSKRVKSLLVEVSITEDVKQEYISEYIHVTKYSGYYIDQMVKFDISDLLESKIIVFDKRRYETVSDTLIQLIQFLEVFGDLDDLLLDDVIYAKRNIVIDHLEETINDFDDTLKRIIFFYLEILEKNRLEDIITGITKILENKQMENEGTAKLQGIIFDIDGYWEISNFIKAIKKVSKK